MLSPLLSFNNASQEVQNQFFVSFVSFVAQKGTLCIVILNIFGFVKMFGGSAFIIFLHSS